MFFGPFIPLSARIADHLLANSIHFITRTKKDAWHKPRCLNNSARVPGGAGGRGGVEEIRMVQNVEVVSANLEPALFTELKTS
jgi:hypothetical protein